MSKLTHRLAALFALAAIVFTIGSARAVNYIPLPDGYTQHVYLEAASGTGSAFINTEINATSIFQIEFGYCCLSASNWDSIVSGVLDHFTFGTEGGSTTKCYVRVRGPELAVRPTLSPVNSADPEFCNEIAITNNMLSVNGAKVCDCSTASALATSSGNVFIFNNSAKSRPSYGRIYYFRAYDSEGNLIANLVPATDSSNVPCLYDTVRGRDFRKDAWSSGNFAAGPIVVPTPTDFFVTATPKEYNTDPATIQYGATNVVAGDVLSATDASFNGDVIACLGYKLYNYTDGAYVLAEESSAKSYTVKEGDVGAGRKLEWQWDSWRMPIHRRTLPGGYQQITYIESTGSQYINTKFVPDATTTIEMDFNTCTFTATSALFGQVWGGNAFLFNEQGNNFMFHSSGETICPFVANAEAHLSITSDNKLLLTIDGEEKMPVSISRSAGTGVLGIFATGGGGNKSKFRLYAMQIYQGGVLVRDYVPCRQLSDGAVGLYDLADHSGDAAYTPFYANVGSGTFLVGEDIIDPTAFYVVSIPACNTAENPIYYGATNIEAGAVLTVPAQITATDGHTYNCLGWRLFSYSQEDDEWVQIEGADGEGAENSYTVKAGDVGAGRKLCWIWEDAIGGRVHCYPVVGAGITTWIYCDKGTSYSGDLNGTYVFDVGSARDITYAFYANQDWRTAHQIWGSNSLDNYATYSAADSGWTKLYDIPSSGWTYGMTAPNWPTRVAGTENHPYRYYLMRCNAIANIHLLFYTKELLVSQEPVEFWAHPATETFNQADPATGAKFTGHVDFVPGAGEATVTLYVANTDHGDDLAAWQADSSLHAFAADGTYATGAAYTIYAPNLPQGVWFGRVFAMAGGVTKASQKSGEFAVGTSSYYPPAYMKATSYSKHYDGNLSNGSDSTAVGMDFLVDDDPDVEIVAVRVFHFNSGRVAGVTFAEDAGATFDFGIPTLYPTVTARTLYTVEKWPTEGWTDLGSLSSKIDCFNGYPTATPVDLPLHPSRWAKFVRIYGVALEDWDEVEFRTLPRPPEPIVSDMMLGEPKGTSIGLTGHLLYRGNANKSPCSVYVSCVAPGNEKDYRLLATGWENATDWAGAVTGLSSETTYELNVVVSNELAGVQVITNASFTTPEFVPMPPSIAFTGVTPDGEGNVTFSWNLTDTGTAGNDVDVYAKWGPDDGNLCEGVKIAEGVAIGLGSAKCEQVEAGADLVFVLYAVNNGGTDAEHTKTSAVTESQEATTFGPASFASGALTRETKTGTIRAKGEIGVYGLGNNRIEILYALVGSSVTNSIEVATRHEGDSKLFDFSPNLNELAEGCVFCRLQVVNSGKGKTWTTIADEKTFACGSVLPSHFRYSWRCLGDGDLTSYYDNYNGPYTLDLGNLRTLRGAWVVYHANAWYTIGSSIWASADGIDYKKIMDYPLTSTVKGRYIDFAFSNAVSNVRYVQLRGVTGGVRMDVAEFHAIGTAADLVVVADHVMAWGNKKGTAVSVDAADDPQGVYFSGKLVSGGPARVYACLSRKDLGADADAWLAAMSKDLGEFANGATVSGYLPSAAPGQYFGKLVAVRTADSAKSISPQLYRANVGTKPFDGAMLLNASTVEGDKVVFDKNNNNSNDPNDASVFIFPVKDLHGLVPASVRFWPRGGNNGRLFGAVISISSNKAEIATTDYCETPKPIKKYASGDVSALNWTTLTSFADYDDLVADDNFWELSIQKPADKAKATIFKNMTYIRISGIARNNVSEMELRLLRPGGTVITVR